MHRSHQVEVLQCCHTKLKLWFVVCFMVSCNPLKLELETYFLWFQIWYKLAVFYLVPTTCLPGHKTLSGLKYFIVVWSVILKIFCHAKNNFEAFTQSTCLQKIFYISILLNMYEMKLIYYKFKIHTVSAFACKVKKCSRIWEIKPI